MVSCLGCPGMSPHARNHTSLAHCGATWWEGEVGPSAKTLDLSPGPATAGTALSSLRGLGPWQTPQGVSTSMLPVISAKLTGDLPLTKEHLPWRQWVHSPLHCGAVLAQVKCAKSRQGATSHEQGTVLCQSLLQHSLSEPYLWKMNLGWSAQNSQGTCPWAWEGVPQKQEVNASFPFEQGCLE